MEAIQQSISVYALGSIYRFASSMLEGVYSYIQEINTIGKVSVV